jgi:hypothetical protein
MKQPMPQVATMTAPAGLRFADELFGAGLQADYYRDGHFQQSYLHRNGRLYCETLMVLRCPAEPAVEMVRGPWTWWDGGKVTGFRRLADESSLQVLAPVAWYLTRVGMRIYPPQPLEDRPGIRLPIRVSRHFIGTSTLDVWERAGLTYLRGRFHGVTSHVPLITSEFAGRMHLRAESGTFAPPFPSRTGWCGLCRRLENSCAAGECRGKFHPGSTDARINIRR